VFKLVSLIDKKEKKNKNNNNSSFALSYSKDIVCHLIDIGKYSDNYLNAIETDIEKLFNKMMELLNK